MESYRVVSWTDSWNPKHWYAHGSTWIFLGCFLNKLLEPKTLYNMRCMILHGTLWVVSWTNSRNPKLWYALHGFNFKGFQRLVRVLDIHLRCFLRMSVIPGWSSATPSQRRRKHTQMSLILGLPSGDNWPVFFFYVFSQGYSPCQK